MLPAAAAAAAVDVAAAVVADKAFKRGQDPSVMRNVI